MEQAKFNFRLKNFNTEGVGLEIAPYFYPTILRPQNNVLYTDYISNEEIIEKAASNPGSPGQDIPRIDFVWTPGHELRDCAPKGVIFDYAFASHVMEHVPNPIGWLNTILDTLKTGATLRLILPDRRTSMDFFRHETTLAQLISYWLEKPSVPSAFQIADFMLGCIDGNIRPPLDSGDMSVAKVAFYSPSDAIASAEFVHNENHYLDAHCTVWTPHHFAEIMGQVVSLGIMNVDIVPVHESRLEFVVDLVKRGDPTRLPMTKSKTAPEVLVVTRERPRESFVQRLKYLIKG
jgi:hypothetical protein